MKTSIHLLLLIAGFSIYAQNSISGKITNTENKPLLGVEIYAPEIHKGTTSKEDGTYVLTNIPNGKIKLTFNHLGYKTVSKILDLQSNNQTLNIVLEESFFEMDEIIISTLFINVASAETQHMTNFETIDKGTVSHYELSSQATTLEIYNHDDWSNFWKVHQHINASSNAPTRPLPEINFVHYFQAQNSIYQV